MPEGGLQGDVPTDLEEQKLLGRERIHVTLFKKKKGMEIPHSAELKSTYFKKTDFLQQISRPPLLA